MDPKVQTSFIPKKSIESMSARRIGMGFLSLIALLVFIASIVMAGGVTLYKVSLDKSLIKLNKDLQDNQAAFDTDFIKFIVRLNSRIDTSRVLLKNHVAITPVFDLLSRNTLQSVSFRDFSFKSNPDNSINVSMKGYAKNYPSIAVQSDVFGKTQYLKDVIFSDLNPDTTGNYGFTFSANLDPNLINYKKLIERQGGAVESATQENTNVPE
jgi:hypothetical protein